MSTTENPLSDGDVRGLLLVVGAPERVGTGDYDTTFEELGLDSLARIEIASRIKERFGVDIEEQLHESETPNGMRRLVADSLSGAAR